MIDPYRTNDLPLPVATPVPRMCRWFGHSHGGTLIPILPITDPLRLIQKCGRRDCKKWREYDTHHGYLGSDHHPWLELHEVWITQGAR